MVMGILDRLKSLFKSEESEGAEEVVDEPVDLEDIDSFLDKKGREIGGLFNEKKGVLLKEISSFLEGIKENIGKLEAVNLDKVKADERLIRVTKRRKSRNQKAIRNLPRSKQTKRRTQKRRVSI